MIVIQEAASFYQQLSNFQSPVFSSMVQRRLVATAEVRRGNPLLQKNLYAVGVLIGGCNAERISAIYSGID